MELESRVTEESLYWPRVSLQKKLPEHTKAVMVRDQNHKYVRRFYEKNEFYDLKEDPEELENKIDDPKYEDIINRLKERLIDFYLETGDAVLPETDERWTNQRW